MEVESVSLSYLLSKLTKLGFLTLKVGNRIMRRYSIIFCTICVYFFLPQLEALNRDYQSMYDEQDDDPPFYRNRDIEDKYATNPECLNHVRIPEWIEPDLLEFIPELDSKCRVYRCRNRSIYSGYFSYDYDKYSSNILRHLKYCRQNLDCVCLWPEYTQEAAEISDAAYLLFRELLSSTALCNLVVNGDLRNEFTQRKFSNLNEHGLTILCIAQQFRFSDYYYVCSDIENFAISTYSESEAARIKDKLQDILEALYPKFFTLYMACYAKHPNSDIEQEIRFMKLLINDFSGVEMTLFLAKDRLIDLSNPYANLSIKNVPIEFESQEVYVDNRPSKGVTPKMEHLKALSDAAIFSGVVSTLSWQSDICLEQGTLLNEFLLYKEAVAVLTQAIQLNPSNRNAYIERAMAYFETNQLTLAMKDYISAKKLTVTPPFKQGNLAVSIIAEVYIPEDKYEFSQGLVSGTIEGGKVSLVEFIPSIFSCCRGILNGLWALVCSPVEVSSEMVNTAYAIGEFVSSNSTEECFKCVVPELSDLSTTWDTLNDHSRGRKIGFIIGKYGVDIFAPAGSLKGLNKVRALKRANTMCTMECCMASQAKQVQILNASINRADIRKKVISNSIKNGKILVRNSNTQLHIMQSKHAWDKVVKISGNFEEDCGRVVKLLEDNKIYRKKYRLEPVQNYKGFVRYEQQMTINGHEVKAIFNKNLETGDIFLNDAWVITQ